MDDFPIKPAFKWGFSAATFDYGTVSEEINGDWAGGMLRPIFVPNPLRNLSIYVEK